MRTIRSILVPVDLGEASVAAVATAFSLGQQLGATVELLHVWEKTERLLPPLVLDVDAPAAERFSRESAAHGLPMQRAAEFVSELARRGSTFRIRFETGDAADAILRVAEDDGHDLIVMGTHGRTGAARLLLGSVAEKVVRLSSVPVLTTRLPEERLTLDASAFNLNRT